MNVDVAPVTTSGVWSLLADIKIGSLVAWLVVIVAVTATVVKAIKSIYSFIKKYNDLKENDEKKSKMLEEHERTLKEINDNLTRISKSLDEQKDINLKYTRHIIVDACHDAITARGIQIERLASLEEMYDEYVNIFNGNSYVSGLVKRVRNLPIIELTDEQSDVPEDETLKRLRERRSTMV